MLNDALGVLSSGQRMFLSAMVSFYNAREGGAMLKRCGFEGLSDLGGLDPVSYTHLTLPTSDLV